MNDHETNKNKSNKIIFYMHDCKDVVSHKENKNNLVQCTSGMSPKLEPIDDYNCNELCDPAQDKKELNFLRSLVAYKAAEKIRGATSSKNISILCNKYYINSIRNNYYKFKNTINKSEDLNYTGEIESGSHEEILQ